MSETGDPNLLQAELHICQSRQVVLKKEALRMTRRAYHQPGPDRSNGRSGSLYPKLNRGLRAALTL